jgi:hypothetical protein
VLPWRGDLNASVPPAVRVGGLLSDVREGGLCPTVGSPAYSLSTRFDSHSAPAPSAVDIKTMLPVPGSPRDFASFHAPFRLQGIVEEGGAWPELTLHEAGSWLEHRRTLDPSVARASLSIQITKAEVRPPRAPSPPRAPRPRRARARRAGARPQDVAPPPSY